MWQGVESLGTSDGRVSLYLADEFPLDPVTWIVSLAWGVVLTGIGFIFFWRAEATYGRA